MFPESNSPLRKNTSSEIPAPLESRVTYRYLRAAAETVDESTSMRDDSVKSHLDAARNEVAKLEHDLEIARVRLETLEMISGPEDLRSDGVMVPPPARQVPRSKVTLQSNTRAAPGSWAKVFGKLIADGIKQFSYDDVVEAATSIGVDTTKPSVRVRVSKFKDAGHLERVKDGVYKPTKEGLTFFKQG